MNKNIYWCSLFMMMGPMSSCQPSKDQAISEKNKCYEAKLKNLQRSVLYTKVHAQFKDTFEILKEQKEYFGVHDYVDNKIDDAIFFNKDSSECMLIVLQKMADEKFVFGTARMVSGKMSFKGKWKFSPSMEYSFAKDYFNLFKENSFENISKLARYSVLTDGEVVRKGCEIDEYYWFVHMK